MQDDPRLIPFNLLERTRAAYQDRWPKPGEELILILGGSAPPPTAVNATAPPLRALAMEPARFEGQTVTIVGQFRGRNLYGELPEAPAKGKYEFVLRSADAALWVIGIQPKGKGFNFDPGKRIDTGRWVTVQGTVRSARGLTWLEGTSIELAPRPKKRPRSRSIATAPARRDLVHGADAARRCAGERMDPDAAVARISIRRRSRIAWLTYSLAESKERGEAQPPSVAFTTNYTKENRALEIRPNEPFERFRLVTLEILEGVKGTDGGPMKPFTLRFTTGGS